MTLHTVGSLGMAATLAAWTPEGDAWLAACRAELLANRDHLVAAGRHRPAGRQVPRAGGDVPGLARLPRRRLGRRPGAASSGDGPRRPVAGRATSARPGLGHVRLNFATSRADPRRHPRPPRRQHLTRLQPLTRPEPRRPERLTHRSRRARTMPPWSIPQRATRGHQPLRLRVLAAARGVEGRGVPHAPRRVARPLVGGLRGGRRWVPDRRARLLVAHPLRRRLARQPQPAAVLQRPRRRQHRRHAPGDRRVLRLDDRHGRPEARPAAQHRAARASRRRPSTRSRATCGRRRPRSSTTCSPPIPTASCDFVENVAAPLPLQIICEMMGIPEADEKQVFAWTNVILGVGDPEYASTFERAASPRAWR